MSLKTFLEIVVPQDCAPINTKVKQSQRQHTATRQPEQHNPAGRRNWWTSPSGAANVNLKTELRRWMESGALDVPARGDPGSYGVKNPAPLSNAIKKINLAKTSQELAVAAKSARTLNDQNAAIRKHAFFQLEAMPANREVGLTFNWDPVFQPEDANVARLCALEFLLRIMRNAHRVAKLPLDFNEVNFVAIPEIWGAEGDVVPLHMHLLIDIPNSALAWFDERAQRVWEQVLRSNKAMGSIHVAPIANKDRLAKYSLKQFDLEWVFDRTLWPIDLLNYQGTSS
jgi:hypothetical protein